MTVKTAQQCNEWICREPARAGRRKCQGHLTGHAVKPWPCVDNPAGCYDQLCTDHGCVVEASQ